MRVLALSWVGTRTSEYAATFAFFRDVLGLNVHSVETDSGCTSARPTGFVYELAEELSSR